MKKILIPVDRGKTYAKTIDIAKDMALKFGSEIIILHVQHISEPTPLHYADIYPHLIPEGYEDYTKYSQELVDKIANQFYGTGINVSTKIKIGNVASEICDFAESNGCDLILINPHGHGAITRFLIGNITSKVVHHSTVPVLVVH